MQVMHFLIKLIFYFFKMLIKRYKIHLIKYFDHLHHLELPKCISLLAINEYSYDLIALFRGNRGSVTHTCVNKVHAFPYRSPPQIFPLGAA